MIDMPTGWIPFPELTDDQKQFHQACVAEMPAFSQFGDKPPVGTKVLLSDVWRHQKVVDAVGYAFPGWYQFSGSCVCVGGTTAAQTLNFWEPIFKNDPDKIVVLWGWYNYGRSRLAAGMRGRGEGSFGSTFAKSLKDDGIVDARLDELKSEVANIIQASGMIAISKSDEMKWSDGTTASEKLRELAKPHPVFSAPASSGAAVRDGILSGYPFTRAGMKFVNPGTARVVSGALVGRYNGRGGHQQSWLGYWNHPELGELIWEQNQWGANAYGSDPGGGPAGGCWVRLSDVDQFCRDQYAEVYCLSQYEGYPDRREEVLDWTNNPFLS